MSHVAIFGINLASLRGAVDAGAYARGGEYARQRQVMYADWNPAGDTLHGVVCGHENKVYHTSAFFSLTQRQPAEFEPRRWVQAVPVVRKTAKWIYYTSDTWDRAEAMVSPGCISRREFETDTRYRADRRGYPAGVIPVPGARPGSAGRLFFATRQAAEHHLYRGDGEQAGPAAGTQPQSRQH